MRKCLLLGRYAVPMDDEEYENKLANRKFLKLLVSRGLVENIGLQKHKHSPYHHGTPTFGITQKGVDSI